MSKLRTAAIEDTGPGGISVLAKYVAQGSLKAWAMFMGSAAPPTLQASLNCSSITDTGTGDWTVNLTNAMLTTNSGAWTSGNSQEGLGEVAAGNAGSVVVRCRTSAGALIDATFVNVHGVGSLA